ncbi:MAG TPA: TonB-dependent receptor, partial [Sunxiuqinia sp.]|nr:TonB-dependent receptor [Sunxiuqinia sp.]
MRRFFNTLRFQKLLVLICFELFTFQAVFAHSITGQIIDDKNKQPVPYATISLYNAVDSSLITGAVSNPDGQFTIGEVMTGNYQIRIQCLGYDARTQNIDFQNDENYQAGTILLHEKSVEIGEAEVVRDRIKAKTDADKTTYFVNKKMVQASNSGLDVLKYVPGVQLDFNQTLSYEGTPNILLLVDGKEHDAGFIRQLDANQIDKVEIIRNPGAKYDANVSTVFNIRLKHQQTGINGYVHAEIPTSRNAVYIFPGYSINYGANKFNLYTSYSGQISDFPIIESSNRTIYGAGATTSIQSKQDVMQHNWSHRFNFGIDYFLNKHNQFNLYAFYNPYSNEHNGTASLQSFVNDKPAINWEANKKDTDKNRKVLGSFYYKHLFAKPEQEISLDASFYKLKANNAISYTDQTSSSPTSASGTAVEPKQNSARVKIDFTSPMGENLKLDAGLKGTSKSMADRQSGSFHYRENVVAGYGALSYQYKNIHFNAGLRVEQSSAKLVGQFSTNHLNWLPSASINYQFPGKNNVKLSYHQSIYRPTIYQLNPSASQSDPFSLQHGYPALKPQMSRQLFLDNSLSLGNNYLTTRLFYSNTIDAIRPLVLLNDSNLFETTIENAGKIIHYGIQFS